MKKLTLLFFTLLTILSVNAQYTPQADNSRIYNFLDELANDGVVDLVSVVKPYSRTFIAKKLLEAEEQESKLNRRQQRELAFYMNDFALELEQLPKTIGTIVKNNRLSLAAIEPAFHYKDKLFKAKITPIVGGNILANNKGTITKRWYGASFQSSITKYISVYGSIRDISIDGDLLSQPGYLNDYPGYQYKESQKGGDYSDSRGGISIGTDWGSISFVKDNPQWGDNYHGSNILSGRAPSFPMLKLYLRPVKWFQLDYFHGCLVSNVQDSSNYFIEDYSPIEQRKHYRAANKFIAANMFTFIPIRNLNLSIGNATIYSEPTMKAAYFIPIAFYKSFDHTLTKGIRSENGNSAMFLNISSRNIKHLHLYTSIFVDEFSFSRLKPSNKQQNPISFKIGGNLTNFPLQNISIAAEYTRSNIINYKHSVSALTWASNSYNMGHYLGDNSQEIYLALKYKPIRGLDLTLSYINAMHGNDYNYARQNILEIISQPVLDEKTWTNQTIGFKAQYEVFNNVLAGLNVQYSNIKGHNTNNENSISGENALDAQTYLNSFTPQFLQGENLTWDMTLTVGF